MASIIERATEEWNALVQRERERNPSNAVMTHVGPPASKAEVLQGGEGGSPSEGGADRIFRSCPSGMREDRW